MLLLAAGKVHTLRARRARLVTYQKYQNLMASLGAVLQLELARFALPIRIDLSFQENYQVISKVNMKMLEA